MPDEEEKKEGTAIAVESNDGNKNKKDGKKGKNGGKVDPDELSEEDKVLKEGLELAVTRLQETDPSMHKQALDHLSSEIRSATASMTSVPKPLKFLLPHYDALKVVYEGWPETHTMKQSMADVMSVLAMTMAKQGSRECLKFKLQGTQVNVSAWGHEYVRSLAGEISEEYNKRAIEVLAEDEIDVDDLMTLVDDIVPFQMKHNAEAEAVDLLMEVQQLGKLINPNAPVVDERNYERVCLYLLRSADFVTDPDDLVNLLTTAYTIYKDQKKYTDSLRVALKMDDLQKISELFSEDTDAPMIIKKQMAFLLGRSRSSFTSDDEVINDIIGNASLSERYLGVARDIGVLDPKSPEDIYKTHLLAEGGLSARTRGGAASSSAPADSARANLASSFVNAFVNAGFGTDKLMTEDDSKWVFKNKDHGMLSAAASLGMVMLWNIDEGLNQIDKFFHNNEEYIKAGACLAVGIVSSGVRNESDPALALLTDFITNKSVAVRTASVCGLGIAYAGTRREELMELLVPIAANTEGVDITEVSLAALALGLVYVGTCNDEVGGVLVQRLMEATDEELNHTSARFLCLGIGLLYLGKQDQADVMLEAVRTVTHKIGKYAEITLNTCAYAGTGNVLKVQEMLRICAEHLTENAEHQSVAVLGIALIVLGEDVGTEMSLRTFDHLLQYGELPVKRVVPLALALLYVSNPDYSVIDQLSRLSHDQDHELAMGAILGLGIVSAGSNNSRVAGLLRQLSEFYAREANHLFTVRIAQGLNAAGKGLLSMGPFHSDRLLMNGPAVGGLLTLFHACLDLKNTILDKLHYLLFFLAPAMNPRFLVALDQTDLSPVTISIRVGQAVETVGQAGRPKTISGFQTHTSPVLLGYRDRAELAGQDYSAIVSVLENVILVEKVEPKDESTAMEVSSGSGSATASSTSEKR